jgi:hypothetical protein
MDKVETESTEVTEYFYKGENLTLQSAATGLSLSFPFIFPRALRVLCGDMFMAPNLEYTQGRPPGSPAVGNAGKISPSRHVAARGSEG